MISASNALCVCILEQIKSFERQKDIHAYSHKMMHTNTMVSPHTHSHTQQQQQQQIEMHVCVHLTQVYTEQEPYEYICTQCSAHTLLYPNALQMRMSRTHTYTYTDAQTHTKRKYVYEFYRSFTW